MDIESIRRKVRTGDYLIRNHVVFHALKKGFTRQDMVDAMINKPIPTCGDHKNTLKEWKPVTFEYTEDGVAIRVPNVYAWVCPLNGEISFTPDTVDELIATVRELIDTAKRAQQRRSIFTEYVVSVGLPQPA